MHLMLEEHGDAAGRAPERKVPVERLSAMAACTMLFATAMEAITTCSQGQVDRRTHLRAECDYILKLARTP
jgi:hypothetical protein